MLHKTIYLPLQYFSLDVTLLSEQCVADLFFLDKNLGVWATYIPLRGGKFIEVNLSQVKNMLRIDYSPPFEGVESELKEKISVLLGLDNKYFGEEFEDRFKEDKYLMFLYKKTYGIRVMKDIVPEYRLIESILTQNTSVRMVKIMQKNLFRHFGKQVQVGDKKIFSYPDISLLSSSSEDELRDKIRCGYRCSYLLKVARMLDTNELSMGKLAYMSTREAREYLLKIKGIGPKVANLILMYGFGKPDVFPLDVWVRNEIVKHYFKGRKVPLSELTELVDGYFGKFASLINVMIFAVARDSVKKYPEFNVWEGKSV